MIPIDKFAEMMAPHVSRSLKLLAEIDLSAARTARLLGRLRRQEGWDELTEEEKKEIILERILRPPNHLTNKG